MSVDPGVDYRDGYSLTKAVFMCLRYLQRPKMPLVISDLIAMGEMKDYDRETE